MERMCLRAVFAILSFWEFWSSMNLIISPSNKTKRNWKVIPTLKPRDLQPHQRSTNNERALWFLPACCSLAVCQTHKDVEEHLTSDRWCFCLRARLPVPVDRRSTRFTVSAQYAARRRAHRSLVRCPWATWTPVSPAPDLMNGLPLVWLTRNCHYLSKKSPVLPPLRRNPHAHLSISCGCMLGRFSADIPITRKGEVQAGRMLCTGEPKAFIIEIEGFKALRWCARRRNLACVAIFASGPVSRSVWESQA